MPRLIEALRALGLEGEIASSGRWVKLQGERGWVYVVEAPWESGYYSWCDAPAERAVEFYRDAAEAIRAGLRRGAAHVAEAGRG
ncbi:MAG: hypothetical protein M5U01_38365 [Ardenticatenaceae bacterium]|nr:hypothetical protein [Ardenticatenaceae bacterium]HBY97361.1 hypothetical protein [Chloroflexota bacterium]